MLSVLLSAISIRSPKFSVSITTSPSRRPSFCTPLMDIPVRGSCGALPAQTGFASKVGFPGLTGDSDVTPVIAFAAADFPVGAK